MTKVWKDRKALAWAFYDFANSAFATTVMAGFFPLFFKQFFCAGADPVISTARLGFGNSAASLAVALFAPFAGAAADACTGSKRPLLWLTVAGAIFTALLSAPGKGQWLTAITLYGLALFCFAGGNIFYDALLNDIATKNNRDAVSSLGFSLGYLGGGLLLLLNVALVTWPELWGISDSAHAVRISFLSVALWWLLFSLPLFMKVNERHVSCRRRITAAAILKRLAATLSRMRSMKAPVIFLAAYWLYMDGVSSVIRMAVDYGLSIGIGSRGIVAALLIVQFTGFPATLVMARIAEKAGTQRTILAGITAYATITIWAWNMDSLAEFLVLAATVGIFQGSIQALSRSFFANMIPQGSEAEFFGFYNITGRFAAVLGPALIGTVTAISGSNRTGILVLLPLFAAGGILLMKVRVKA